MRAMTTLVYVIYDGDPEGPLDRLAKAIAEGAQRVANTEVILHRPNERDALPKGDVKYSKRRSAS